MLGFVRLSLPATETRPSLGLFVVILQGVAVIATVLGAEAYLRRLRDGAAHPIWQRGPAAVLAVAAAVVPLGGLGWWLVNRDDALTRTEQAIVPAYMEQSSQLGAEHGVLVIRGSIDTGVDYRIRRGDGITLGEDEILSLADVDREFDAQVRALVSAPTSSVVKALGDAGIEYVVLPSPADGVVAAGLDATAGLDPGECRGPLDPRVARRPAAGRGGRREPQRCLPDVAADHPGDSRSWWCWCWLPPPCGRRARMTDTNAPGRGRRPAASVRGALSGRIGPLELIAIIVPLLTVAALALVRPIGDTDDMRPPTDVPLTRATLVCPPALPGTGHRRSGQRRRHHGRGHDPPPGRGHDLPRRHCPNGDEEGAGGAGRGRARGRPPRSAVRRRVGGRLRRTPRPEQWFTGCRRRSRTLLDPRAGQPRRRAGRGGRDRARAVRAGRRARPARRHGAGRSDHALPSWPTSCPPVTSSPCMSWSRAAGSGSTSSTGSTSSAGAPAAGTGCRPGARPARRRTSSGWGEVGRPHARARQPGGERGTCRGQGGHQGERVRAR
ncbi:hypothetical protein LP418_17725 [Nocardioides sp. B-3]|nr:hypothetical protein [Nocardioides sp. B-3]UUZ58111.1 hypothetical protein LP418_17725 [Nocardioides sp. B-3]